MQPLLFWSYLVKTMLTVLRISQSLPIIIDRLSIIIFELIMMEEDTFTVAIGEEKMVISKQVADVSQYFHNILTLGIDQEEIQVDPSIVDKATFELFLRFCAVNGYAEPVVGRKITTSNLEEVIDSKNYDFIKAFPIESESLMKLLGAANFLVCKGLKQVIAAVYACKIYFEDSKEAYIAKKKELGIPQDQQITFEEEERYLQDYMMEESILQ